MAKSVDRPPGNWETDSPPGHPHRNALHLECVEFLPREAMLSAVFAVVVCLSVCLCVCVCLSHYGIVSKRLNVGSRKQRRMIAP